MCCHPVLSPSSAVALTLRAVGGLTTFEIAKAFLVPEATMAQRISRAKQSIKASGVPFAMPTPDEGARRLGAVMHVLYLIFSEGYTASAGPDLQRVDLSSEAIRLTRTLHGLVPDDAEVAGLLALMVLTDARRAARTGPTGEIIPLDQQDRTLWDPAAIREGVALLTATLPRGAIGPYQLQAAIAAVHDEAASADDTDWSEILALYGLLQRMSDNPMVTLNHAVAMAMVHGPAAGLERLDALAADPRLEGNHRLDAVRAHLLERAGDRATAILHYRRAAERTTSIAERNYLFTHAARLIECANSGLAHRLVVAWIMGRAPLDTSEEAWARMEQGVRRMTPAERVQRAVALTIFAHGMALAQIRRRYPDDDERQHKLRLASRYLDAETMRAAFGWTDD